MAKLLEKQKKSNLPFKELAEAVKSGIPAIVNIWVDKEEFAPGTKNQTMYK